MINEFHIAYRYPLSGNVFYFDRTFATLAEALTAVETKRANSTARWSKPEFHILKLQAILPFEVLADTPKTL